MVLEDDCCGDVSAGDGSVGLDGVGGGSCFAFEFAFAFSFDANDLKIYGFSNFDGVGFARDGFGCPVGGVCCFGFDGERCRTFDEMVTDVPLATSPGVTLNVGFSGFVSGATLSP